MLTAYSTPRPLSFLPLSYNPATLAIILKKMLCQTLFIFVLINFITFTFFQVKSSFKKLTNKTACSFPDLTWTEQWQNPVYFLRGFIILRVWCLGLFLWLPPSKNTWCPRFQKGCLLASKDHTYPCADSMLLHEVHKKTKVHKNAWFIYFMSNHFVQISCKLL